MMTALATVTKVVAKANGYDIEVSCEQQTSCKSCASQKSCGTGIVSKAVGNKQHAWALHSELVVREGQTVEIGFPEASLLQSALLVYLLPLLGLLLGALAGQWLFFQILAFAEWSVILSGVIGGYAGFLCAKHFSQRLEQAAREQVSLLRVLGEPIV